MMLTAVLKRFYQPIAMGFIASSLILSTHAAVADTLTGAGGTAIYPVLSEWAASYKKETGTEINYQAIGSGGGIKQIQSKTVAFANSDKPLTPDELNKSGLAQFPAVIIGITPVVNLPGVKPGEMVLNGSVLADIYLGKITHWNSPAIHALNPGMKLPDMAISTVHRSDGSGTTFNFTNYLSKVSPEWKEKAGSDTSISWPNGVGGKGNAGVAAFVKQIPGSIGYVEYAYTMETKLIYTRMVNADNKVVTPSMESFQAASGNADFSKVSDFYLILTNQPGAKSWPITAATYILMRKDYPMAENQKVLKFARWFLEHGQAIAEKLAYVPLPKHTVSLIESYWKKELGI
ncbi:MAG: phosphate ABC transporter substrate-binding protein PstS [Sulfuricella sp.]